MLQIDPTPAPGIDAHDLRATLGLFATGGDRGGGAARGQPRARDDGQLRRLAVARSAPAHLLRGQARPDGAGIAAGPHVYHQHSARGQKALSTFFADRWPHASPPSFQFVRWEGGARLEDAVGAIGCAVLDWLEGEVTTGSWSAAS
jgi:hypothetical protein